MKKTASTTDGFMKMVVNASPDSDLSVVRSSFLFGIKAIERADFVAALEAMERAMYASYLSGFRLGLNWKEEPLRPKTRKSAPNPSP